MRALSLFSGIGGIDLAMEAAGITVVGQVEIDPYCQRVLAHHWPEVRRYGDIHAVQGNEFGAVDLMAGGFPCQAASAAGQRRGRTDSRHLWPEYARLIRAIKPRWVVGENVGGLLSIDVRSGDHGIMGDILRDMAEMGYSAGWCCVSAADVGAPHLRERIFIIAHLAHAQRRGWGTGQAGDTGWETGAPAALCGGEQWHVADTAGQRSGAWWSECQGQAGNGASFGDGIMVHASGDDPQRWRGDRDLGSTPPAHESASGQWQRLWDAAHDSSAAMADPCRQGLPLRQSLGCDHGAQQPPLERGGGRSAEPSICEPTHGFPGGLAGSPRWPARPGEKQHVWEAPRTIPKGQDKGRAAKLKALGNAVIPAQILPVFQAIMAYERGAA